jgi:hypothetical protein
MKLIPLFFVLIFFACCTPEKPSEKNPADVTDSILSEKGISGVTFDEKLFRKLKLPLVLDTTFVMKADTNERISFSQVRGLKTKFADHPALDLVSYPLNEFCRIDSLKENEVYADYVKGLDIGMTKNSIAFKVGWLEFDNGTKLFLWGLNYTSFEACPFFSGKVILGTFVNEKNENTTFVIAERSGGGDPPSMGNTDVTAKITADGVVDMESINITDDLDIPGEETTRESFSLKLEKDKVLVKSSTKKTTSTEKPAVN